MEGNRTSGIDNGPSHCQCWALETMNQPSYRILKNFSDCKPDVLLKRISEDRGCTDDNWQEFISDEPPIHNPIRDLSSYQPFKTHLQKLPESGTILIYGDYDCDGITSSVIMHDLLLALGVAEDRIHHFIPDRFKDGYGLTEKGWESATNGNGDPAFLITVDCGTPDKRIHIPHTGGRSPRL
jgi:single-stranded-DNA-specific exonuclease